MLRFDFSLSLDYFDFKNTLRPLGLHVPHGCTCNRYQSTLRSLPGGSGHSQMTRSKVRAELSERTQGHSPEPVAVSAYFGSSRNPKDLKDQNLRTRGPEQVLKPYMYGSAYDPTGLLRELQGYLAHEKEPPPLGPP